MYYPNTSAGMWPNPYQINTQQQQAMSAVYYQLPSLPTTTVPEMFVQQQQPVPTVYYQTPSVFVPPIQTTTTSEAVVPQPQTTSTTTTKSVTTRILDPSTIPTVGNKSFIEETKTTTTVNNPETQAAQGIVTSRAVDVPPVTTTTIVPTIETTRINERPERRPHRFRNLSTSTYSDDTTTSTSSTFVAPPPAIQQQNVFPSQLPYQTTGIAPVHRVAHRPYRSPITPSGYQSSDLDYGKRKVYKTDYKYRHYYCCNWCRGRVCLNKS
jgi:hypothetical protein